jgi:hypothetical protein
VVVEGIDVVGAAVNRGTEVVEAAGITVVDDTSSGSVVSTGPSANSPAAAEQAAASSPKTSKAAPRRDLLTEVEVTAVSRLHRPSSPGVEIASENEPAILRSTELILRAGLSSGDGGDISTQ